jgi:type IV pilus assembly protein PilC
MGRRQWDTIKLKIPAKIGDVILKISLARWSRTFSGLVHSGVPILQAIDITGKTAGNWHIEKAMADVKDSVQRGGSIAEPLEPVMIIIVGAMVGFIVISMYLPLFEVYDKIQ